MKLLITAATGMEIRMFLTRCRFMDAISDHHKIYNYGNVAFDMLITGIGTAFTTFHLTQAMQKTKFDLVINVGIAGSLSEDLAVGTVVNVVDDEFADLGVEEEEEFITLFDSGFMKPDEFPFENRILRAGRLPYAKPLPRVKGITTNISHGRKSTIARIKAQFSGQVETMEGAAVIYVCRWLGVPCLQIRSVSNVVAPRDIARWDIPLALENLGNALGGILEEIGQHVD